MVFNNGKGITGRVFKRTVLTREYNISRTDGKSGYLVLNKQLMS